MTEQWYAIVADQDVYYPSDHPTMAGKLEYKKGDVVSWGSVIAPKEELSKRGLRAVYIGSQSPNFETHTWNPTTEKLEPKGGNK